MTDSFLIGKILIVGGAGFNLRISTLATDLVDRFMQMKSVVILKSVSLYMYGDSAG